MKKYLIISIFLTLFAITGCSKAEKSSGVIELSYNEVTKRMHDEEKDTFFLFLSSKDCYTCDEYIDMIKILQKEKPFVMYYVNVVLEMSDQDIQKELDNMEITAGEFDTLPTTYYIENGSIQNDNIKEGYVEPEDFKTWLKTLKIW